MIPQQVWWRTNRFPLFVAARTLSIVGDFAAAAAITVYLYQSTGSGLAVSGFFAARIVPRLLGPLAGALADRFDPRDLLIFCDVAACAFYLLIAWLTPSYLALLGMVLLVESLATVSAPSARTLLAKTIPAERRAKANAILMLIATLSMTAGSGVGGVVSTLGYRYALVVNAGTFVASAVLLGFVPSSRVRGSSTPRPASLAGSTLDGVRALLRERALRLIVMATAGTTFAVAVDRPALVGLVQGTLKAGGPVYGFVLATTSVGGILAAALALRSKRLEPSPRLFAIAVSSLGIAHLTIGLSFALAVLFVGALMAGVAACLRDITGMTLLQGFKKSEFLGVVMGTVMSGTFLADAFGSLVGGLLTDTVGPRMTYLAGSGLLLITATLTLWRATALTRKAAPEARVTPVHARSGVS